MMDSIPQRQVSKIVTKTYWDCGHPDHSHITEESARACIHRKGNHKRCIGSKFEERDQLLTFHILNGDTYDRAGEKMGISGNRARQILRRAMWSLIWWLERKETVPVPPELIKDKSMVNIRANHQFLLAHLPVFYKERSK